MRFGVLEKRGAAIIRYVELGPRPITSFGDFLGAPDGQQVGPPLVLAEEQEKTQIALSLPPITDVYMQQQQSASDENCAAILAGLLQIREKQRSRTNPTLLIVGFS